MTTDTINTIRLADLQNYHAAKQALANTRLVGPLIKGNLQGLVAQNCHFTNWEFFEPDALADLNNIRTVLPPDIRIVEVDEEDQDGTDVFFDQESSGVDLRCSNINDSTIEAFNFRDCRFDQSNAVNSSWSNCQFQNCSFDGANMEYSSLGCRVYDSILHDSTFAKARMKGASLFIQAGGKLIFDEADLTAAELMIVANSPLSISFANALMDGATVTFLRTKGFNRETVIDFQGAKLTKAKLNLAHPRQVSFVGAIMSQLQVTGLNMSTTSR